MRNFKRNMAAGIVLILFMLCMFVPVQSAEAYTTGDTYPARYKNRAKDAVVDQWGYYNRECTSFVAYCLYKRNGFTLHNWYKGEHFGNAKTWLHAARQLGFKVNSVPAVGAVGVSTAGRAGHVVWVKSVNGDKVTTDEYNWNNDGKYHTRTADKSTYTYIHFKDITYKLNVNLTLDGDAKNGGITGVTYDVTVGGTKKGNNVKEYNAKNPAGQSYCINDIRLSGCYKLAGKKTYSGTLKGNVTVTIPVKADHDYDAGVITKKATCTTAGVKTYTCKTCGAKKTTAIAALGHDFQENATAEEAVNTEEAENTDNSASVENGDTNQGTSSSTAVSASEAVCHRCGAHQSDLKITIRKASIKRITSGSKRLTVTMASKASATGGQYYQIAYKQRGTSKWKYTTTSSKSKTIKSLKKGKKYSVKVRAYKKVDGKKYYGSWSKTKTSAKVK